jgi:hypothetical protein
MIDLAMAVLIGFAFHYRNRVGWRQSASVAVFAFFVVFPQAV